MKYAILELEWLSRIWECLGRKANHANWEKRFTASPMIGFSPQWPALEEGETKDATIWGLHSITLETTTVVSEQFWPESLPGAQATIEHVQACFGELLIHEHGIAVFQVKDPEGLDYGVQCVFNDKRTLQSLTMVRLHDWLPLEEMSTSSAEAESVATESIGLSGPGAAAPETGWYEGLLPEEHPM